jgi:eukaryotic-like serine/threonine-protein kinase
MGHRFRASLLMLEPHSSHFWLMASRSGLIAAARLQECWEAIPADRRTAESIDRRLAREVVKAGCLTAWQARMVAQGRANNLHVNKYTVMDEIGQGGMGKVYLARDTRLNRPVALKILSRGRLHDKRAIARFRREVRLGAQLQHENIVRVYDEGELGGQCYLIMEYIEGSSVGRLLAEHGPMPPPTAARLVRQVALGLEHARRKGMIHRDVNPHNILVTREGVAKLTDLGLAIEFGDEGGLTLEGAAIGNYDYISPEQAHHSRDVDTRSDLYSLGCTLYHMVSGRVPFPFASLPEKIHALIASDPPPLGSLVAGLPEGFEGVVSRMMRKSPDERFQGPMDAAKALEPFIEGETFASGRDLASAFDPRPAPVGQSRTPASPDPLTSPGPVDALGPPRSAVGPSTSSASAISPRVLMLPTADAAVVAEAARSREIAEGAADHFDLSADAHPIPPPGPATRRHDSGSRWHPVAIYRSLGPRDRVAFSSLLAVLILTTAILMAWPRGRGPKIDPDPGSAEGSTTGATREESGGSLTVTVVKADGGEEKAESLKEALRLGGRGDIRIILRGGGIGPIRLESEGWEVPSGTVTIGADPEAPPVLVVSLSGRGPFLRVGTRATLKLIGLTIRAEYAEVGVKPSPLIEARGMLELERCAFWTTDRDAASGAVLSEGPRLNLTGCWFGGFRQCLDIAAFAGAEVVVDQCMMIQDPVGDPWNSWAVRIRHEPALAAVNSRRLVLRRCTIRGACLLRADDFQPATPLQVAIEGTVVQAGVLLAWRSESGPVQGCLDWSGRDNLYDLSRASRVIRLDGPNDPDAWTRMMVESGSRDQLITFPGPAPTVPDSPRPADFRAQDRDGISAGADPAGVGPGPSPLAP